MQNGDVNDVNDPGFEEEQLATIDSLLAEFDPDAGEGGTLTSTFVSSPGDIGVARAGEGVNFIPGDNDDNAIIFGQIGGPDSGFAGVDFVIFGANVDTEQEVKDQVSFLPPELANTVVNVFNEFNNGATETVVIDLADFG